MSTTRRKWFIFVGIVLGLFLTVSEMKKFYDVCLTGNKTGDHPYRSKSPSESRERGILVAEFEATPASFQVNGTTVTITEARLEERTIPDHFLVWFPYERRMGGYHLHISAHDEGSESTDYLFEYEAGKQGVINDPAFEQFELKGAKLWPGLLSKPKFPIQVVLKRKR